MALQADSGENGNGATPSRRRGLGAVFWPAATILIAIAAAFGLGWLLALQSGHFDAKSKAFEAQLASLQTEVAALEARRAKTIAEIGEIEATVDDMVIGNASAAIYLLSLDLLVSDYADLTTLCRSFSAQTVEGETREFGQTVGEAVLTALRNERGDWQQRFEENFGSQGSYRVMAEVNRFLDEMRKLIAEGRLAEIDALIPTDDAASEKIANAASRLNESIAIKRADFEAFCASQDAAARQRIMAVFEARRLAARILKRISYATATHLRGRNVAEPTDSR